MSVQHSTLRTNAESLEIGSLLRGGNMLTSFLMPVLLVHDAASALMSVHRYSDCLPFLPRTSRRKAETQPDPDL